MPFDVPAIWRQPINHEIDCYFCLAEVKQNGRHKSIKYADVNSFTKPIPHMSEVQYPICPKRKHESNDSSDSEDFDDSDHKKENKILPLTQAELNDWIRDLELPKRKAELLASRMKERGFVNSEVKISYYRRRHESFSCYFSKKDSICYCHDIKGLFHQFGETYNPNEWRLFIDSSQLSLKAVLLKKGNEKPTIPLAHAVKVKESYESMSTLLGLLDYKNHNWKICADLKVVAMLTGLQQGYTKHCCFLCKWDSRARQDHYVRKDWPDRVNFTLGQDNVKNKALVPKDNIILPPLHIKLGLFKNFIKALFKRGNSVAFQYIKTVFPFVSDAKIKEGVFVGPQISKLLKDSKFNSILSEDESKAWKSFGLVVSGFLGTVRSPNFEAIIQDLLKNYEKIGTVLTRFRFYLFYINICF